jgi:hypothetical protein
MGWDLAISRLAEQSEEVRKMLATFIVRGLETDGAHHKQWYLEEILKTIAPSDYGKLKEWHRWEDGVAP